MTSTLRISRQQLAAFLKNDHDAIRQFENLFNQVETTSSSTDVEVAAWTAESRAQQALDELEDLRALVDLLVVQSQNVDTVEGGSTPAPGPSLTTGTAVIDFGAFPGSNEASVVVAGQPDILANSETAAWLVASATGDHTANDHAYASFLVGLTTGAITPGSGFTIYGRSPEKMQGTFNVQWAWN